MKKKSKLAEMIKNNYLKSLHSLKQKKFSKILLKWRGQNNFDSLYPWRNSKNRYYVLLSEILLKKTTRKQVASEWSNITSRCNDFNDLQNIDLRKLKKVLKPLGLEHTRSKHLKDLSKKILADFNGKVPGTKKELLSLPGVGPYTANAVLCFAFGHDVSMLDVNILRVIKRVFSLDEKNSREAIDMHLWEFAEKLPPAGKGKEFNYAILDFASEVCTAKNPKCSECPVNKICNFVN
ncbi:base excision DNA repair protein [Candidatus Nitrosarchaeum limnium]|nr:base excision DNA repair protein [Candidatus Nitrosarchaeum limnium]